MNIYSRPRGRGGRGRTSNKDSVHNTKAENRVQRIGQKNSTNESQQDHEISSSYKISSFQQTSRFNADQVEKKLQQRYDEAMYSALQNTSGAKLCKTNQKPWSKGSAPVISYNDFLTTLHAAQKDFEKAGSTQSTGN